MVFHFSRQSPGDVLYIYKYIYISLFWYDVLRHYLAKNMISLFAQRQILCYMATKYLFMSPHQRKSRILVAHTMKPNANKNEPLRFFNPLNHYLFMWNRNKYVMFLRWRLLLLPWDVIIKYMGYSLQNYHLKSIINFIHLSIILDYVLIVYVKWNP